MNVKTMEDLHNIYIKILKEGRTIYNSTNQINIQNAQKLETYSNYLGEIINEIEILQTITHKYASEFLNKANEIRKNIDCCDYKNDDIFLFKTTTLYKGLSWADVNDLEEDKENLLTTVDDIIENNQPNNYNINDVLIKSISSIDNIDLGFNIKIPIINRLSEIPATFYWYNGDENNRSGIYVCITDGFYSRVPFPNVIDSTNTNNKVGSIRCKHITTDNCFKVRNELAMRYNSTIRSCNFAHTGDSYIKIGTSFRCPQLPRFGNHQCINNDLDIVQTDDIKIMLMYALSDTLLSLVWFQKNNKDNIIYNNIEMC